MKNLNEWKELVKETMGREINYSDNVSVFIEYNDGYIVIENEGRNGLQLQFRRSLDHDDIVVTENIVAHGKIVSALVLSNYDDVKKVFSEFVEKL